MTRLWPTVRTLFLTVALVWIVSFLPSRAVAYGVYESNIAPGGDAAELYSLASPTPAPFPMDIGLEAIEGYLDGDNGDLAAEVEE